MDSIKKEPKPSSFGGMRVLDYFECDRYSLAFVEFGGFRFVLSVRPKGGAYLVKPEKTTRPSELNITKKAISLFCEEFCGNIISSNLLQKKEKTASDKLLDPLFFCQNGDFFDSDVAVEIGFGSGRHLLHRAKAEPKKKFIGVEIYKPSIEQVRRRCELEGIENVYILDFDARLIIDTLKSGCVSQIYVHFPVPWPNSPNRRVISKTFLNSCARALKEGGYVELRSDDRGYFEYAFCEAMGLEGVRVESVKNEPAQIVSKYEDRWLKKGKEIFEMRIYPQKPQIEDGEKIDFGFEGKIEKGGLEKIPKEAMVKNGILVSFDGRYSSKSGNFALKVTFGDTARPDRRYIVSIDDKVSYYPFEPLCIKQSAEAHKIIKEFLYG